MVIYDESKLYDNVHIQKKTPNPQIYALFEMGKQLEEQGGGSGVTVDSELSTTSENPVQNKVITTELNSLDSRVETNEDSISDINTEIDDIPNQINLGFNGNHNLVLDKYAGTSVADQDVIPVDQTPDNNQDALISSKAVYDALEDKADTDLTNVNIGTARDGYLLVGDSNGNIDYIDQENFADYQLSNVDPGSGTAGQVLTVNANADGVEWATPSGGFTAHTYTTEGEMCTDIRNHMGGVLRFKGSTVSGEASGAFVPSINMYGNLILYIVPGKTYLGSANGNTISINSIQYIVLNTSSTSTTISYINKYTLITLTTDGTSITASSTNYSGTTITYSVSGFTYYY